MCSKIIVADAFLWVRHEVGDGGYEMLDFGDIFTKFNQALKMEFFPG